MTKVTGRTASLVVGVGARRGARTGEVLDLIGDVLRDAGLSPLDVVELATVEAKADEPGIVGAAGLLGVALRAYPAELLASVRVPSASGAALTAVGTPSVAEAAALARGGELIVPKRRSSPNSRSPAVTCAVVRRPLNGVEALPVDRM